MSRPPGDVIHAMTVPTLNRRQLLTGAGAAVLGTGVASAEQSATDGATDDADGVAEGPTAYVATGHWVGDHGALFAVDATSGEVVWTFDDQLNQLHSSPIVVDGTLYVGDEFDTLYALDAATGDLAWTYAPEYEDAPGVQGFWTPTVVDGTVYVQGSDGRLHAVDAATGTREWTFDGPIGTIYDAPAVADGTVFVGTGDGEVYAVDAAEGIQQWVFEGASNLMGAAAVVDGTVFVPSIDGNVYALAAATGDEQWRYDISPVNRTRLGVTVTDGTVYVSGGDAVHAVHAEDGAEEWTYTLPDGDGTGWFRTPTVVDQTAFVPAQGMRSVHAVDATTGERLWAHDEVPDGPLTPTVFDGTLYVSGGAVMLEAVDAETGDVDWTVGMAPFDNRWTTPTVVTDPAAGDSVDSNALLATDGHHDEVDRSIGGPAPEGSEWALDVVKEGVPLLDGVSIDEGDLPAIGAFVAGGILTAGAVYGSKLLSDDEPGHRDRR